MSRRTMWLLRLALIVAATILATAAVGWGGLVVVGIVFALLDPRDSAPLEAGAGAAVAWALILLVTAFMAGVHPIAAIGEGLGVPALALPLVSVLFAAAVAWSSAEVARFVRRAVVDRASTSPHERAVT